MSRPPISDPPSRKRTRAVHHVAYFCMEYGLIQSLPLYAGGLGILAGDMVKEARDGGHSFCGIGILWDKGYSSQNVSEDGSVTHSPDSLDKRLLKKMELPSAVSVTVGTEECPLTAYTVEGYEDYIYLIEPEKEEHKYMTDRLYQGAGNSRLYQECILGVGGVRLLRALNKNTNIYHFNEGHAVFAGLELIRDNINTLVKESNIEDSEKSEDANKRDSLFTKALEFTRRSCVFTTHTPVPAGNETHPLDDVYDIVGQNLGFTKDEIEKIGGNPFGMTEAAMSLAFAVNAVSRLHQKTAAKMWEHLKCVPAITYITNGVHLGTWQDDKIRKAWVLSTDPKSMVPATKANDAIWLAHQKLKQDLLDYINQKNNIILNIDTMIIGFARRAVTYKRSSLIFATFDKDKQKSISAEDMLELDVYRDKLSKEIDNSRLGLVYSGKCHPCDNDGKKEVLKMHNQQSKWNGHYVYLENYDMNIGSLLTRGCDVWLNHPRRPMEACGTSGMKAAANGVLNCSILDGWWDEACVDGQNGWKIGVDENDDSEERDIQDCLSLLKVMLEKVVPCFYDDVEKRDWRRMMRNAIHTAQSQFSATRMMNEYQNSFYIHKL